MFGSLGKSLSGAAKSLAGTVTNGPSALLGDNDFMSFVPGIGDSMAAEKQNRANIAAAIS